MANREACELYIEQEIKEGLSEGKTPYSIGKDLSTWVEKLFETNIPARTLEQKARRATDVASQSTSCNPLETLDNQVAEVKHGGKREGAGPPLKYEKVPEHPKFTNAIHIAIFVISHLERITFDDPKREEALQKVSDWIDKQLKEPRIKKSS